MQGQILEATAAKSGTILGDDGARYGFAADDWRVADFPAAGMRVDFVPGEGSTAREIFPLPGAPRPGPSPGAVPPQGAPQPVYAPQVPQNNSQLLGWIGIACLIVGFVVPIILPTIAALILGLIGADSAKRHGDSTGLVLSRIAWIGALAAFAVGLLVLLFAFAFVWPFFATVFSAVMEAEGVRNSIGVGFVI